MTKIKIGFLALLGIVVLGIVVGFSSFLGFSSVNKYSNTSNPSTFGSVYNISDRSYIDALGTTSTAPATLTSTYNTSAVLRIPGLSNLVLAGTYTPKSAGSLLYIQLERSVDNGITWYPYDTITPSTDRVSVYSNSFTTSSTGVPFQIPGSGTVASGTSITFSFDATLAADYVRVSAKESTTSTYGTLYLQLLSTNH